MPSWLVPGLFCVVSIGAGAMLKLHFDGLLTAAAAATVPDTAMPEPTPLPERTAPENNTLRSSPADPGFEPDVIVDRDGKPVVDRAVEGFVDEDDTEEVSAAPGGGDPGDDGAPDDWLVDESVWVDPASSGRAWSELGAVEGLLTFRGNPTRTYYGQGPLPTDPQIQWAFSIGCSNSPVGNEPKQWCGSGWTGQPSVFRLPTTDEWTVAFGAYNRVVNFLDPATGREALPPYATGDIIKGSVTVDPDGYPLLYTGSRDNFFHVVALDGPQPESLWKLSSEGNGPTIWNNDWDGSALVVDDHLFVGGENGRFYVIRLNRGYDDLSGRVVVEPEVVFSTEGWDSELLQAIRDQEASIENSVAISGDTVYFSNSGGLVQGWDVGGVDSGATPTRTFRYWTGDDTDASIVIDGDGMLYIGSEYQRLNQRGQELGQIIKLDPSRPDDPLVWSRQSRAGPETGIWATPALHDDLVIVATNEGELIGLDRATGDDRWRIPLEGPLWSSPVVVDDVLVQGDCEGALHAFDLDTDSAVPPELWSIELGGCIESTPAVWDGQIFVGSRSGEFFAVGDAS